MKDNEKDYLDSSIIRRFRETINSSPIFVAHEEYKHKYNLICVFMDRIDSAIQYLNANSEMPRTEEEFINFLVYAAIIRDGVTKLFENIFHNKPPYINEKMYFTDAVRNSEPFFTEDTCPTDDDFFEYIRAMAFAHPYEVSGRKDKRPFMQNGEIHYCPWVIVNPTVAIFSGIDDGVGIRCYTKLDEDANDSIMFSFAKLKQYILSRYEYIDNLTQWAKNGILDQTQKWQQIQINRSQEPIKLLREIKEILESRFESSFTIDNAIKYLECPSTEKSNDANISLFRNAIIQALPCVCDCVDRLDYNRMEKALDIIYVRPKKMHQMAHYQLEKIFSYLDSRSEVIDRNSSEYWGLLQAYEFSQEFAKKWVNIDVVHMLYDEIKLLVRVACFLEAKEQENAAQ